MDNSSIRSDLIKTVFKFVKKLRDHPKPDIVVDPAKGLPHAPLVWLSGQLGIDSLTMYVYPTSGRAAIKKRIFGNGALWMDLSLEQAALHRNSEIGKTLFAVRSHPRGSQKHPSLLGYLGVARVEPLEQQERDVLQDVADFVGEYMYDIFAAHRRQQCQRAHDRVLELTETKTRPGTLVRHVQGVVHRAIRAHTSYFCVLNSQSLVVEYYQRHTWNRPNIPKRIVSEPVGDTFWRLSIKESFFQWVDLSGAYTVSTVLDRLYPRNSLIFGHKSPWLLAFFLLLFFIM
jgi:hypothetical protein